MNEIEIWMPIENFERYEVSSLSRIRSVDAMIKTGRGGLSLFQSTLLKSVIRKGYATVNLSKEGRHYIRSVHRLVAEAFIPNPDNLPQVNHKDGNKLNNLIDNLEWCTPRENTRHALATGLAHHGKGEQMGSTKLSEAQVIEIRKQAGIVSNPELAKMFSVSESNIYLILCRKTWSHLP